ncbi:MAG TPA: multicopper oxidase domain-containing protein [Granulicella sp.]|nr:multicopper oxidase domain-containing protein [Granulicella sp.]
MELQSRIAASALLLLLSVAAVSLAQNPQDNSHPSEERQLKINSHQPIQAGSQRAGSASSLANVGANNADFVVADRAMGSAGGPLPAATAQTTPATNSPSPVLPVENPCPRYSAGSVVHNPPALFSSNGVLEVRFSYQQRVDSDGRQLFCFMTPDGLEDPTLHLKPGDHLILTVTNNAPDPTIATPGSMIMPMASLNPPNCGDAQPTASSINIHYHGTNTSPACHQDNVLRTVINPGETFQYNLAFPWNEPSGLYWYHPHIHMLAQPQTQGGATGALVIEGIENQQPAVSGLRERILVVRDQAPGNFTTATGNVPNFDLSLNFVLISSPTDPNATNFVPTILKMRPGEKEFWRVANASADAVLDLQYVFDGVPQPLQLVAVDGVPLNSQDGSGPGALTAVTHFALPPASRVEFIAPPPSPQVQLAQLITLRVNGGPYFYNLPQRPLATVQLTSGSDEDNGQGKEERAGRFTAKSTTQQRFAGLATTPVAMTRNLYFDEVPLKEYYMVVEGQPEALFDPNAPPAIVATQGTVEEWIIENRTPENHAFHIHQIHFLVESQNNFEVNGSQQAPAITGQYLDTVQVPFWDGNPDHPYPSVKLRLDFRGKDIGDFVFHCHILSHEDAGMMAIVRVQPSSANGGGRGQH